jgi:hypothetical protein
MSGHAVDGSENVRPMAQNEQADDGEAAPVDVDFHVEPYPFSRLAIHNCLLTCGDDGAVISMKLTTDLGE